MFCVLNNRISKIDFDKEIIIKYSDGRYRCKCSNTSTLRGFSETEDNNLMCNFCGRIFNKETLEVIRGITI